MLGHPQEAEDALQEVLLKVFERLDQYTYSLSFSAWLYKIAFHHCSNLLKRKKRARLLPFFPDVQEREGRNNVDEKIDHAYLSEPIHSVLCKLGAEERHIVIMRVLEEREYEEIAALLNKNASTLRKKFERALKKCKRYLQTTEGGTGDAKRFV